MEHALRLVPAARAQNLEVAGPEPRILNGLVGVLTECEVRPLAGETPCFRSCCVRAVVPEEPYIGARIDGVRHVRAREADALQSVFAALDLVHGYSDSWPPACFHASMTFGDS